ncbi:hypothetical protein CTA1_11895 [Colletotrichum tanaceti]|uniref:Ubiquitin-like protease family profile domain-containing protein n=1 Tax=Colletotrichum tanaceti TaxID=1306861 RepID=A0A4U6X073_9PEZI|nr:hypothetical protein CTA1_11895 [Colletotrichum tanaceti]
MQEPIYASILDRFNSLTHPDAVAQRQHDTISSLWAKIQQGHDSAPLSVTEGDSLAVFALRRTNRAILSIALDTQFADELASLQATVSVDLKYRLNAVLDKWAITKSIFLFLFGSSLLKCRFALTALSRLHAKHPEVDILALYRRLELTSGDTGPRRGRRARVNVPLKDRLKDAICYFSPTAWPKKPSTAKKAKGAPLSPNEVEEGREEEEEEVEEEGEEEGEEEELGEQERTDKPVHKQSGHGNAHPIQRTPINTANSSRSIRRKRHLLSPVHPGASPLVLQHSIGAASSPAATTQANSTHSPASPLLPSDDEAGSFGGYDWRSDSQDGDDGNNDDDDDDDDGNNAADDDDDSVDVDVDDTRLVSSHKATAAVAGGFNSNHLSIIVEEQSQDLDSSSPGARYSRLSRAASEPTIPTVTAPPRDILSAVSRRKREVEDLDQDKNVERKRVKGCQSPSLHDLNDSFEFTRRNNGSRSASVAADLTIGSPEQPRRQRLTEDASNLMGSPVMDLTMTDDTGMGSPQLPSPLIPAAPQALAESAPSSPSPSAGRRSPQDAKKMASLDPLAWLTSGEVFQCLSMFAASSNVACMPIEHYFTSGQSDMDHATLDALSHAASFALPMFVGGNHWILAHMRREEVGGPSVQVDLYDPLPSAGHALEAQGQVDRFLDGYFPGMPHPPEGLVSASCPRQLNDVDCGVFVIAFQAYLSANCPMPFAIDSRLWRVIARIIHHLRVELCDAATRQAASASSRDQVLAFFASEYLDHDALGQPCLDPQLFKTPCLALDHGKHLSLHEAQAFANSVREWEQAATAHISVVARERAPLWASALQQVSRARAVLMRLHSAAVSRLTNETMQAYVQEETCKRHVHLGKGDSNEDPEPRPHLHPLCNADQARIELRQTKRRIRELQVCVAVWPIIIDVLSNASAALQERFKLSQPM